MMSALAGGGLTAASLGGQLSSTALGAGTPTGAPTASNTVVLGIPIDVIDAMHSLTRSRHRRNGRIVQSPGESI